MNKSVKLGISYLVDQLSEQGVNIAPDDVHYSLMNREEWIYVNSGLTGLSYPDGVQFGVYINADREQFLTDTSVLPNKRQRKRAEELLKLFSQAYDTIIAMIYDETTYKVT